MDYERWKAHVYYRVIDSVVSQDRSQSADMVKGTKGSFNFNESKPFTDVYSKILRIDGRLLEAEKFGESLQTAVKNYALPNILQLL